MDGEMNVVLLVMRDVMRNVVDGAALMVVIEGVMAGVIAVFDDEGDGGDSANVDKRANGAAAGDWFYMLSDRFTGGEVGGCGCWRQ